MAQTVKELARRCSPSSSCSSFFRRCLSPASLATDASLCASPAEAQASAPLLVPLRWSTCILANATFRVLKSSHEQASCTPVLTPSLDPVTRLQHLLQRPNRHIEISRPFPTTRPLPPLLSSKPGFFLSTPSASPGLALPLIARSLQDSAWRHGEPDERAPSGDIVDVLLRTTKRKKKLVDFLWKNADWGIGARVAKRHWAEGSYYQVCRVKVSKTGKTVGAWGVFHKDGMPQSIIQRIGGANKPCWKQIWPTQHKLDPTTVQVSKSEAVKEEEQHPPAASVG